MPSEPSLQPEPAAPAPTTSVAEVAEAVDGGITRSSPPPTATPLQKLFGTIATLQKGNTSVPTASIGGSHHAHVLLYFSAQWCPPCRRFTPRLAKLYKELRDANQNDFEVVFVSCDSSAGEFAEYAKEMPFPAMPFVKKKERDRMLRKFKVQSLPTLVVLDSTGSVVLNKNAVHDAREEGALSKFPWKSRTLMDILADAALSAKDGSAIKPEALASKTKHFALYYAAQWSPPCRAFTPQLMSIYKQLKESKDDDVRHTEIIFVSCDKNVDTYEEFYDDMPWATMAFQDPAIKELAKLLDLASAPTLITFKSDGTVVNKNARYDAADDLSGERFPWAPAALPAVTELQPSDQVVAALNEACCFILHVNGSSNAHTQLTEFRAAAECFAPQHNDAATGDEDIKVRFFVTPENDTDLLMRVVAVVPAQLPPAGKAFVLCMSLAGEKMKEVFSADITKDSIVAVATKFAKKVVDGAAAA